MGPSELQGDVTGTAFLQALEKKRYLFALQLLDAAAVFVLWLLHSFLKPSVLG